MEDLRLENSLYLNENILHGSMYEDENLTDGNDLNSA